MEFKAVLVTGGTCGGLTCFLWLWRSRKQIFPRKDKSLHAVSDADIQSAHNKQIAGLSQLPLASHIVKECQSGNRTASSTLEEFLLRSKHCSGLTNCVVEPMQPSIEQRAREIAQQLDSIPLKERQDKPLFGLPFSVKECFLMKSTDSTIGLQNFVGRTQTQDAALIAQMIELGAVPLCKTNVPQIMYSFECSNPVYGCTSNPLHRSFIPGGSSGGEASLIAAGGSIVGLGTDIGGSCRIPAHMSGCCGLKCTRGRMSLKGKSPAVTFGDGQQVVASCAGPLAATTADLIFLTQTLCEASSLRLVQERFDNYVVPVPWDSSIIEGKQVQPLRIGWYEDDGYLEASPACKRAVREAVAAFQQSGAVCVQFNPPDVAEALETYFNLLATGGPHIIGLLSKPGEVTSDSLTKLLASSVLPSWLRTVVAAIHQRRGAPVMAGLLRAIGPKTGAEYYEHVAALHAYRAKFAKAFQEDLDLLLAPVHVLPAIPHMTSKAIVPTVSYSALYNILDYPAGVLPVTTLKRDDLWDGAYRDTTLDPIIRSTYAKSLAANTPFPIGVQLIGRPFKEELVLRGMRELEIALQNMTTSM